MGLFGKKNKNKEKGVPFWKRNKQKQEEELVQEELTEQENALLNIFCTATGKPGGRI